MFPNRKYPYFSVVVFILTGCHIFGAHNTDGCIRNGVINVKQDHGHILSTDSELQREGNCQLWSIQGQINDTIVIRISVAYFDKASCDSGSNLIIGPLPYLNICALDTLHLPLIYHSKRDHVWIKYLVGLQQWDPLRGSQFALVFSSSSSICSFRCIFNGTCVPKEWQCNDKNECSGGEDEYMCNADTDVDHPPLAVTSPDVILQYPQTSFTLYGDRSTDDHGIVKYLWNKISSGGLSCDMEGTHSPVLHLSNLQVGSYTFRLIVYDELGQTSSADVHVTVKLENRISTTEQPVSTTCDFHEIKCYVTQYRHEMCLHNMFICDGNNDCAGGEDENKNMCGDRICNKRLAEPVGWFASPNFPNVYPVHSSCSWVIHKQASSLSSTIQLRVVFFSLEDSPNTDYVKVYDGPGSTYTLIGTYYGSNRPPAVIESSSNWMNVVFKSDDFNSYKGFNFTYQIKENRNSSTEQLVSTTCDFHEIKCYVTQYHHEMCLHNMFICDGNNDCAGGEDENTNMCGDRICNKRLEEPVGWFASPNFPNVYPVHRSCSWVIHKQASSLSSTIQLRVVSFTLEDSPNTDYVKVYDGPDSTYTLIGTYYGSNRPPAVIESSSNWMNVVFQSDDYNSYKGFNFTYQIKGVCLPSQSSCVGETDCFDTAGERCDGIWNCPLKGSDEIGCENRISTTEQPVSTTCDFHEIKCYVTQYRHEMCLHNMFICDGNNDCVGGEDENKNMCGDRICNKRLEEPVGSFASPNFPNVYPVHSSCSWVIHKQASSLSSTIQLRVVSFTLEDSPNTDYVKVYDGPDSTYTLIGTYYGSNRPPAVIESSSNWMNVVFKSDDFNSYKGFNFTYQIKGVCLPSQSSCVGETDCFDTAGERCDGIWNCPLKGSDEIGCGNCKDDYTCGRQTSQCYHPTERCNGLARCSNSFDEINCSSEQCGTHNGTFLCDNGRCIYESWTCDERDDCGDNSDEQFCTGTTKRVVIAAICGSMICALLLVILLGCSCKLYSLRTMDHQHRYPRHETPMSRLYAEFLRRRAPPPYHEAMLTSRNFDEVQQEYLERMQNSRRSNRGSRGNRRRSRNQQNQSQRGNAEINENQANAGDSNNESLHEGRSDLQLCTINEENENDNNVNTGRTSSTAELLPSESESESDDVESETDLAEQGEGHIEGQSGSNNSDHANEGDNGDEDDDENILASTSLSAQWMRNVDSDDSSDDVCILDTQGNMHSSEAHRSRGRGQCDNASIDTEATASIASMEQQEIPSNEPLFKDSENESDSDGEALENSRNSTPKPDSNHGNAVISQTSGDYISRVNSHNSLNSVGSETYSETDVPLLPITSVVSQHF